MNATPKVSWSRALQGAIGALMLVYGVWAIFSGRMSGNWGSALVRPSVFYWLALVAVLLVGAVNLLMALLGPRGRARRP